MRYAGTCSSPDNHSQRRHATDHTYLTKVDLHNACVPYEERAKGVPPAEVMRCTNIVKRDGGVIAGCGFERRIRRFAFETEAW